VVDAARRADARAAPVVFVLMGEGSQRQALETMARGVERLRFLPLQHEDELANVLNAADVLLISERSTVIDMSLPSKLTSYFAAGRPVVAAVPPDGSTAREVLRSGGGLVVPIGDPDELNRVVGRISEDAEWAGTLGMAGRRYAESALDLGSARARIDRLLALTLGRSERS
jgi:glycosyltransferase involved in cell wall biosynthesis